ncbi:MAG: YggS family pyridoxal phosphate-dependent enzyme, partial [Acidobacteriota bacterium]
MSIVAENYSAIKARVSAACARTGRDPNTVRIVGVTKTVPVERIREGVAAGIAILGENYVQEAEKKVDALSDLSVSWHFIGHLQSNKARSVVSWADCIHTVDRESLAVEIDRQARKRG